MELEQKLLKALLERRRQGPFVSNTDGEQQTRAMIERKRKALEKPKPAPK